MRYLRATATSLMLVAAAMFLAGCTTGRIAWEKAGVAQAERERDENACLRSAITADSGGGQLLAPYCIDREVYTRCMESRGYTVRSQ
ncbi:MAG TPA: hypothetical protein VJ971_03790 [Methylomirabilota bacterium]|jgi:hypothetical protein|nr:hypothetical protein [Methylomirabilota bacterium]